MKNNNPMQPETNFTVLENTAIGRNIALYRKIRGLKATQVAERLGLKEAAYTKYERGEAAITINMVQQIAELLKVDPLNLMTNPPSNLIENGSNSPNAIVALNANYCQTTNDEQLKMTLKLIESVTNLNEKLITIIDKR
jgi:transcriptional regulator with XRE-family HTH domain